MSTVTVNCSVAAVEADKVGGHWSAKSLLLSYPNTSMINTANTYIVENRRAKLKDTYTGTVFKDLVEAALNKNITPDVQPDNDPYYPNLKIFTVEKGGIDGYSALSLRKIAKVKVSKDRTYGLKINSVVQLRPKMVNGTTLITLITKASNTTTNDLSAYTRSGFSTGTMYTIKGAKYWTVNIGIKVEGKKVIMMEPSKFGSITTLSYFTPSFFSMDTSTTSYAYGALRLGAKTSPYIMCAVVISTLAKETADTEDTTTTTTTTTPETTLVVVTNEGDNRPINKPNNSSTSTGTGVTTGICSVYAEADTSSMVIDTIDGGTPINVTWYQGNFAGIHYDARYSLGGGTSSDSRRGGWILRNYAQVDNVGDNTNTWENGTAPAGVDATTGLTTGTTTDGSQIVDWTDPLIHVAYTQGMTPSDDIIISSPDQYSYPYAQFDMPGFKRAKIITHINEDNVWKARTFEFLVGPTQSQFNGTNNINPIKTGSGFVLARTGPELSRLSLQGYLYETDQANERSLFFEKYYKEYMIDKVNAFHEYFNDSHTIIELEGFRYYAVLQSLDMSHSANSLFLHMYTMQFIVTFTEPMKTVSSGSGNSTSSSTYSVENSSSSNSTNVEVAPKNVQSVLGG